MKSTVEQLSPTRVKIAVQVPFDELKPNFDRAYRKLAQQARIPGFRPGKAPARVLENRLGRGAVLEEVVNEAIPTKYHEALTKAELRPLGRPEIEVTEVSDREQLTFTAEVDVRPTFELPDATAIAVTVDDVEVTDEAVAEHLDALRARFGTLSGVDRPAAEGDFVVVDLSATVDGRNVEEAAATGLSHQIGSGGLVDGIDEALTGLSAGESATFTTTLVAGEYAGHQAQVTARVTGVKERELPEPDDEFAQLASEFDTLDELRGDLRDRLGQDKRLRQAVQARDNVLQVMLDRVEIPLPDDVVTAEIQVRNHEAFHAFDHDQTRFEEWLSEQGKTREEFDTEAREDAERSVRAQLLLDAIADAEEVAVSEVELVQQLVAQARQSNVNPQEFLKRAQQSDQLGAVYADLRRGKALVSVVRRSSVTDESGDAVDLTEFLRDADADSPDPEDADPEGRDTEGPDTAGPDTGGAAEADAADAKPAAAQA